MSISYDEFQKMELKIGQIVAAERVEGSDKLLKMQVDLGEREIPTSGAELTVGELGESGTSGVKLRQIIAGIGKAYTPESLVGRQLLFIANLEPRTIMGLESQGMVLAASDEQGPIVLCPDRPVAPGSVLK